MFKIIVSLNAVGNYLKILGLQVSKFNSSLLIKEKEYWSLRKKASNKRSLKIGMEEY